MQKEKILILGGGVSGLTLAYDLSQQRDRFDITLIEQDERLGGWIDSDMSAGFFFEKGPRVFRGARSAHLLQLIGEVGLKSEVVEAHKASRARYIWKEGKLRKVPLLSWGLIRGLMNDLKAPQSECDDESVWEFACRRFNTKVASDFFEPLVVGIFGGGVKEISMDLCFPRFKAWERRYGSVIKGAFKEARFDGPSMFTLSRGLKSLTQRLVDLSPIEFRLNEKVVDIKPIGDRFHVTTDGARYEADYLFSALPCPVIGKLMVPPLTQIPLRGTTVVNLGYTSRVLKKKAFGYLVAPGSDDDILGVTFDSMAFPHYNHTPHETRLTVMLKETGISDTKAVTLAIKGVERHLKVRESPTVSHVIHAPGVFPQLRVGHRRLIRHIEQELSKQHPRLFLTGNYLYGVGVNDCIERARSVSANFLRAVAS